MDSQTILNIYEEIVDLEDLIQKEKDQKRQLSIKLNELQELERNKMKLTKGSNDNMKKTIEEEYENVCKQISLMKLKEKVFDKLEDLETLLEVCDDKELIKTKTNEYFKNQIIGKKNNIFIKKQINEDLGFLKQNYSSIYENQKIEIRNIMRKILNNKLSDEVLFLEDHKYYILDFDNSETDNEIKIKIIKKEIRTFFLEILMENFKNWIVEEELDYNRVGIINEKHIETEFYVNNINEWIVDVLMKKIIEISKSERKYSKLIKNEQENTTHLPFYVSEEYKKFIFLIKKLDNLKTRRLEKLRIVLKKAVLRFFDHNQVSNSLIFSIYMFADIIDFTKTRYSGEFNDILPNLLKEKEELFYLIIENSGYKNYNFIINNSLKQKAIIKNRLQDFFELINTIMPTNLQHSIKISYFEHLFRSFILFVFHQKSIGSGESDELVEISSYLMSLSSSMSKESISNYFELESLNKVLSGNLNEIENLCEDESICIEKNDLIYLINISFEDSEKKSRLISKIKKTKKSN